MKHVTIKKFSLRTAPNGEDIVTIVQEHNLQGWSMDIKRVQTNNPFIFTYEIIFSKENH